MNVAQISKTYVYFSKLIITELNPSPHFEIPTPDQIIASGSSAVFKIDLSIQYVLYFYVVDSVDEIDASSARAGTTVLNPGCQVIYEFEGVKISSLSAPYHLDCYDYSKHGVKTQKQCYYSCLEKRFFNIHNKTSSAFRPLRMKQLSQSIEGSLGKQFLTDDSQVSHCHNLCKKPDCRSNVFITRQNSIGRPNTEVSSITVNAQSHETSITHLPKMAMSQFVMYLGATLGLWYGVSFLDSARLITYIERVLF
ncbi:hypothetical protein HDE_03592 [Halotydeus destructor]|nr:hypothetical protein HDE_03592 [Halotydeus destructor]